MDFASLYESELKKRTAKDEEELLAYMFNWIYGEEADDGKGRA
jgi:hypothetical protein